MASEFEINFDKASRHALVPPHRVALDADPLVEIAANCSAATLLWVAALLDRIEPVDQCSRSDSAIRDGVRLCWRGTISASAKAFVSRLQTYVVETYTADEAQGITPGDCTALRSAMWNVVRFNRGDALSWRQILTIAER